MMDISASAVRISVMQEEQVLFLTNNTKASAAPVFAFHCRSFSGRNSHLYHVLVPVYWYLYLSIGITRTRTVNNARGIYQHY